MSRTVIAPSLPRFLQQHRDIEVVVTHSRPNAADIVLTVGEAPSEQLIAHSLCPIRLVTCASKEFVAINGVPREIADLDPRHCIRVGVDTAWEFYRGAERQALHPRSQMMFADEASAVAAAVRGGGFVQLPQYEVDEALASGLLVEVLARWSVTRMLTAFVHRHASTEQWRVQTFLGFLRSVLPCPPSLPLPVTCPAAPATSFRHSRSSDSAVEIARTS
jgi:LysR family transcriptional regulator, regulator for bpeEF and oprC